MLWRFAHRFLGWAPPSVCAAYAGALGVAATAAPSNDDARVFLDSQIAWLHSAMTASWFLPVLAIVVVVWLAAFLWTGARAEQFEAALARQPTSPLPAARVEESGGPDIPTPSRSTPRWIPLGEALRHIVREAAWAKDLRIENNQDPEEILQRTFFEAAARGDVEVWGRNFGWATPRQPMATSEPIPREFWRTAFMQPFAEILFDDPNRSVVSTDGKFATNDRREYREVTVRAIDLERVWPRPASKVQSPGDLERAYDTWEAARMGSPPASRLPGNTPLQERRRRLIDEARSFIAAYDGDIGQKSQRDALESCAAYLALRKHLSERFMEHVASQSTHFDLKMPGPMMMRAFAAELDRLEEEWGLDE